MTTIAACSIEGVMCSDSGWTDGTNRGTARKVFKIRGSLLGFAGNLDEIQPWIDDYRRGVEPSGKHVQALRLEGGRLTYWVLGGWMNVLETRFAIGTGAQAARGAMAHGATVREAVRTAITLDAGSFGPVRTYRV